MKALTLAILCYTLLMGQSNLMQSINNLKKDDKIQEAIFDLHKVGKNAIPLLINAMVDSVKTVNILLHPWNSTINHLYSLRGFRFLYTIELILLKDTISGCLYPSKNWVLKCPENYLHNQGVIVRAKTHTMLNYDDLVNIQLLYESWWKKVAELQINEIRRNYKTIENPLKNSPYKWE